jgi:hypothetical protein
LKRVRYKNDEDCGVGMSGNDSVRIARSSILFYEKKLEIFRPMEEVFKIRMLFL